MSSPLVPEEESEKGLSEDSAGPLALENGLEEDSAGEE
jgi:hypothetical protein